MSGAREIVLTPEQRRVVDHPLGKPGVVDAGAGTGKTFTIVERVAALHERGICSADKILLLTFARKAAAELRARIARRLGSVTPTCSTFHAFALSVLADHAYDVGISPETTVVEDADARVEFQKAFDEFLGDPQAPASGFPLRTFNSDEIRKALFQLDQKLKGEGVTIEAFRSRALAAAERFSRIPYRALLKHAKPQKRKTQKPVATIDDAGLAQEVVWEKQRAEACADILRRFETRLAARNALTYADILARAERALRDNEELRDGLRKRYRACIVDEYQDTDLAQHRLLESLFGAGLASVVVVGDALQSIFSFRGARPENVEVFLKAPESTVYTLVENRRSRQEILDLAHASVVVAHDDAQQLRGERGVAGEQIVHVSSLWTAGDIYLPADQAREREAASVARRICQLLASGRRVDSAAGSEPISPKHIAILSRTKKNVQPVTQALLAAGIPFKLVGGVGFYDAPEVRDVLAWMRLLANPFDSHAVARALQSAAIGASDALVVRLAAGLHRDDTAFARRILVEDLPADEPLDVRAREAAQRFRDLLDELAPQSALPLLSALGAVIETTGIARAYGESADPRAEQALANLLKLEALARSFLKDTPGAQPADFVAFINELENVDYDEREADVSASEAVTIATIHAAKGLEWPFVFVLGVWPRLPNDLRLVLDDRSGSLLYAENPDGSRSFHYQSVTKEADEEGVLPHDAGASEDPEERRLLYVALTRARDRLFLSGLRIYPSQANPGGRPHGYLQGAYDWVAQRGWGADENVPDDVPRFESSVRRQPAGTDAARARRESTPRPSGRSEGTRESALAAPLSYSLIARYERCPRQATYKVMLRLPEVSRRPKKKLRFGLPDDTVDPSELAPPDSLLSAGEYGEVLHKALELWAVDKRNGLSPRHATAYLDDAIDLLFARPSKKQIGDAQLALAQIARELDGWMPVHVEAPFTVDFGEEGKPLLVSGYLDLLARDAEGQACLIDYKTGDQSTDHALQLALYQLAAREVYGIDVVHCFVGQIDGKNFRLERVQPANAETMRARILAVREGLLARDDRATPGDWCWSCGYRNAPCRDFKGRQ